MKRRGRNKYKISFIFIEKLSRALNLRSDFLESCRLTDKSEQISRIEHIKIIVIGHGLQHVFAEYIDYKFHYVFCQLIKRFLSSTEADILNFLNS
jgi:hypothetical protein